MKKRTHNLFKRKGDIYILIPALAMVALSGFALFYLFTKSQTRAPFSNPLFDVLRIEAEFFALASSIERHKRIRSNESADAAIIRADILLSRLDKHPYTYQVFKNGLPSAFAGENEDMPKTTKDTLQKLLDHTEAIRTFLVNTELSNSPDLTSLDGSSDRVRSLISDLSTYMFSADYVARSVSYEKQQQLLQITLYATVGGLILGILVTLSVWRQRNQISLSRDNFRISLQQREKELLRSQKMEAMGQLTAGVAHDFNNLLAVILGNAELIGASDNSPNSNQSIRSITKAVQQGKRLTDQLLLFSGRVEMEREVINLNEFAAEFDQMIQRTIPENIKIDTILAAGLGKIEIDRALIESTLMNLVINAYEQLKDREGIITIETANVWIDEFYSFEGGFDLPVGRYVLLAVSDNGPGIPVDLHEKIFEPFYSTKDRGSGLGLSTAYGLVRKSGGIIRVYSEIDEGTTFKLYFPMYQEAQKDVRDTADNNTHPGFDARSKSDNFRSRLAAKNVLIVEDNLEIRETVSDQIRALGHIARSVSDADAALKFLETGPEIDVVLSDLVMPGKMQGGELATQIKERWPNKLVIVMSGYPNGASSNSEDPLHGIPKLTKPISMQQLSAIISDRT